MKVKNLSTARDLKVLDEAKAPPPSVSFIYPNNLTFVDYLRFIFLVPVLVYEAKYVVT